MQRILRASLLALLVSTAVGCSAAYTKREIGASAFGELVYGLYSTESSEPMERLDVERPLRIGVAEIGEVAPLERFKDRLEERPDLVAEVIPLPVPAEPETAVSDPERFHRRIEQLRRLAVDLDIDWLFLFGGYASSDRLMTASAILDITILPALFVPSHEVRSTGKSAGALVHTHSGRVALLVNAEDERVKKAPGLFVDERQASQLRRMRGRLMRDLANELLDQLAARSGT